MAETDNVAPKQESRIFHPAPAVVAQAKISGMDAYHALCREAEADYEGFWARLARENLHWQTPFTQTLTKVIAS